MEQGEPAFLDGEQQAQGEARIGPIAGRPGRRVWRAISPPIAAGEPGDGERQRPQLAGDVGRRSRREEVGPSVDQAAGEVGVGARGGDPADGDAAEDDEGHRGEGDALAEQQPAHRGRTSTTADAPTVPIAAGADEAPARQRAAEADRRDHRHRRHDRDGDRDVGADRAARPLVHVTHLAHAAWNCSRESTSITLAPGRCPGMRSPFGQTRTRITRAERRAIVDIVRKRSVGTLPVITTSADVADSPRSACRPASATSRTGDLARRG